ncbi:pseudouridine synthase [Pseudopedobacter beijingensis]|uniref:Pseudouridine synthase n=1 Tax=Pseudopedobacter beijingensis TaxID=1207056 RepID=A0ABW4I932_9SPHI
MPFNNNRKSREDKSGKEDKKPFKKFSSDKSGSPKKTGFSKDDKSFGKRRFDNDSDSSSSNRRRNDWDSEKKGNRYGNENTTFGSDRKTDKPFREKSDDYRKRKQDSPRGKRPPSERAPIQDEQVKLRPKKQSFDKKESELIRLNRYIANSGICSRRKADELITSGEVKVNGIVVSELGAKVNPAKDEVKYNGKVLKREKMVYVLLNKPKDFITTTEDPQERKTVMELVKDATNERIYPVGRLDRNTTGLLLLTNDGELAEKLSHPRNNITKIYNVELSKNLTQGDFNKIAFGVELEDGFIKPDSLSYVAGASKKEIGIQIHSGKNRIVRRIFESLDYEVVKLDRVIYANLTKKDLPRGRWRHLTDFEIVKLKHFTK